MRLEVQVRPGASRTRVGGDHDGALVVRVAAPAEHGKATEAALRAVADALALPRRSIRLARGSASRRKVLEVDVPGSEEPGVERRLAVLRGAEG